MPAKKAAASKEVPQNEAVCRYLKIRRSAPFPPLDGPGGYYLMTTALKKAGVDHFVSFDKVGKYQAVIYHPDNTGETRVNGFEYPQLALFAAVGYFKTFYPKLPTA